MCYYNGIAVTASEKQALIARARILPDYDFWEQPLFAGPTYPKMPMLMTGKGSKEYDLVPAEWGFLPPDTKTEEKIADFRKKFMTLNAKVTNLFTSEKVDTSMFAEAAMNRRCLIPSTHFFEYRHIHKRGKNGKILKETIAYPYLVRVKDQPLYYFAGIWNDNNLHGKTISIVTTEANVLMSQVHNLKKRMPSILTSQLANEWVHTPNLTPSDIQTIGAHQYDSSNMESFTVNKPLLTSVSPMEPVHYQEVPPLGEEDILLSSQSSLF